MKLSKFAKSTAVIALALVSFTAFTVQADSGGDPSKTDKNYESQKGWPNWSQYAGSMGRAWGYAGAGGNNEGCVTTSRIRAGASHGAFKGMPSKYSETSAFSVPGVYSVDSGASGPANIKGSTLKDQIKDALPRVKSALEKGKEVDIREKLSNGGGDEAGGTHTVMVDKVDGDKIWIMDPAVGAGGNWKKSPGATPISIVRIEIISAGKSGSKRESFSGSDVRAQLGGAGNVVSAGGGSSSSSDSSKSDDKSSSSSQDTNITIHPIFNPFQPPMQASKSVNPGSANSGAVNNNAISTN